MLELGNALRAWGTPDFKSVLQQEMVRQSGLLPLQQGLSYSSSVADTPITVLIHSMEDSGGIIRIKAGIFYQGIIGGCSCADDPTPQNENNEYCEVALEIDKASAMAKVILDGK